MVADSNVPFGLAICVKGGCNCFILLKSVNRAKHWTFQITSHESVVAVIWLIDSIYF